MREDGGLLRSRELGFGWPDAVGCPSRLLECYGCQRAIRKCAGPEEHSACVRKGGDKVRTTFLGRDKPFSAVIDGDE